MASMSGADSGISGVFDDKYHKTTDKCAYVATDDETFSITSSILNYQYENGRRYHAFREGSYYAPNDEDQNNQLDIFHHIYLMILDGGLYIAPIQHPKRILDIGTGTGIWVMDMAEKFPNTEIIGTDLSPIQPEWVPPNVRFEIDDAESGWTYGEDTFDFIHIRCLFGAISDWPTLVNQAYKHLAPGGWIEVVECKLPYDCDDGTLAPNSYINRWSKYAIEAGGESGKPLDITDKIHRWLQNAGFQNTEERSYKCVVVLELDGPWSKDPKLRDIGRYNLLNILEGMDGFTTALFTRYLGWNRTEAQAFYGTLRQELTNPEIHSYFKQFYWVGQKSKS